MDWVTYTLVPAMLFGANLLLLALLPLFFLSGLDDFFVDAYYIVRRAYRATFVEPKHQPLTLLDLHRAPEQPIAILVPAWQEEGVVGPMVENLLRTVNYENYHVFVGTYPNDPGTQREVESLARAHERVHQVVGSRPGPTNKADCLNHIFGGIVEWERKHDEKFEIFLIHDSEDVVHPLSLRLHNYLIPRKDMVQIPVFPLEVEWTQFTGGHYLDEFAENHLKTLVTREFLSGGLPSAGTGCSLSRRAVATLAAHDAGGAPFDATSITEDYQFGLRLQRFDMEAVFVKKAMAMGHSGSGTHHGRLLSGGREYIATREYFPRDWSSAVRQKSRWILGIVFQGWEKLRWTGHLMEDYMLARDRKAPLTAILNILGYLVVACIVFAWLWNLVLPGDYRYPTLITLGGFFWYLLIGVTFFLLWRLAVRFWFVHEYYGLTQAVLSIPRFIWGNFINFAASLRAMRQYGRSRRRGEPPRWETTQHAFPAVEQLAPFRRRLGEVLVAQRLATAEQVQKALQTQRQEGGRRRIGEILVDEDVISETDLDRALRGDFE